MTAPDAIALGFEHSATVYTLISEPAAAVKSAKLVATADALHGYGVSGLLIGGLFGFIAGYLLRGTDNRRSPT